MEEVLLSLGYFVQHPHSYKTGSADHFRETVENFVGPLQPKPRDQFDVNQVAPNSLVVLYQADEHIPKLRDFKGSALIVPMFDEALDKEGSFFRTAANRVYISFSKYLHFFLLLNGCISFRLQYWPEKPSIPPKSISDSKNLRVFFWERTPTHVSWEHVLRWFSNYEVTLSVRQHWDPDHFGTLIPNQNDNVVVLPNRWSNRTEYIEQLTEHDVFIAPRRWEGIGVSALEAMTLGISVVGLDSPAQNEYVRSRKNGYLLSKKNSTLPSLDFDRLGRNALYRAEEGREKYLRDVNRAMPQALELSNKPISAPIPILPKSMTLRQFTFLYGGQI